MAQDGLALWVAPLFGLCRVAPRSQTHEGYAPSSRLAQPKNRRNATYPNISTGSEEAVLDDEPAVAAHRERGVVGDDDEGGLFLTGDSEEQLDDGLAGF